jgi:hypothetical protein
MEMNNQTLTVEALYRELAQLMSENRGSEPVYAWLNHDGEPFAISSVDELREGCVELNLVDLYRVKEQGK